MPPAGRDPQKLKISLIFQASMADRRCLRQVLGVLSLYGRRSASLHFSGNGNFICVILIFVFAPVENFPESFYTGAKQRFKITKIEFTGARKKCRDAERPPPRPEPGPGPSLARTQSGPVPKLGPRPKSGLGPSRARTQAGPEDHAQPKTKCEARRRYLIEFNQKHIISWDTL